MRKITALFAVLFLCTISVVTQAQVKGKVTDSKDGSPLEGVSVKVKGSNTGVSTGSDGTFELSAKTGVTLVFSSTGFEAKEVKASANMSVSLAKDVRSLSEVVVTALGIQRQKKDLGYSTAKVSSAELTKANAVNVANGLQGKVSGLNVTSVNNGVFEDVKINLRGIRSLTGNNSPMLLIDGVPVALGYLSSLNPNDIADVNVLKGTGAAAIYGPDAKNGVIIVTTKKGNRSGAPTITVSHSTQLSRISFWPKMQNEFGTGGYGEYIPYENWSWGPAFDGSTVEIGSPTEDGDQQYTTYSAKPNERKNFFNTGVTTQNDVSFATKDFYMSFQDANIKGIVPGDKNRRTGIRVNTSKEYGKFKIQFNTNYIQSNYDVFNDSAMSDFFTANNVGGNDGLMDLIINTAPHIPLTSYKDFRNSKFAQFNNYYNHYGYNPYWAIDNWRSSGRNDDLISNIDLNMKATDWLSFTYRAALTMNTVNSRSISKGEDASAYMISVGSSNDPVPGTVAEGSSRSSRVSSEFFASLNKKVKDFGFDAQLGTYFRQTDTKAMSVGTGSLVIPELFNISNRSGELNGSAATSKSRQVSYYGRIGVNYKGWANVEVTGRNDQVSVLDPSLNSYFYPGASVSFVASDAINAIKNSNLISFLKVRGSWNKTGSVDIAPYKLSSTFSPATTSGFPYNGLPGYTADDAAYDPKLKPEFIESKEVGLELGLFKNRVSLEATYFHQNNTDQIVSIAVSSATGYTTSTVNAASFVNKGLELDLKLTPLVNIGKAKVDFKINAMMNDSKITSIYEGLDEIFVGGFSTFAGNFAIKGQPAFVWKLTDYERDDQGRVIVDDASGYPTKDPNLKVFGRTMPKWILGLNPSATWKGLTLSILAEYKGGHYAYHDIGADMAWTGTSAATAYNHRERFVMPNSVYLDGDGKSVPNTNITITDVNDFYTGSNTYRGIATNFFTSAAAWRLRELSLGYEVPLKVFGKQNVIKGVTVTLTGRNLFLWVPKSNQFGDPDFNFTSDGNSNGVIDVQVNPPVRTYGASISVKF